jgi:hypothetical protein
MNRSFSKSVKELWRGKRVQAFYLSLEFKNNLTTSVKLFNGVISKKYKIDSLKTINPNLINQKIKEEDEYFLNLSKELEIEKLEHILNGELYDLHMSKIFGSNFKEQLKFNSEKNSCTESKDRSAETIYNNSRNNNYDPFKEVESSVNLTDINYKKLNTYSYFMNYSNFLLTMIKEDSVKQKEELEDSIKTFVESLCKMYIGHNIHYKIEEQISKKTNYSLIKGDYYFSLGYYNLSKLGYPVLIKYYSKISQMLSIVSFY